jgi:hypothetical protein
MRRDLLPFFAAAVAVAGPAPGPSSHGEGLPASPEDKQRRSDAKKVLASARLAKAEAKRQRRMAKRQSTTPRDLS